MKSLARKFLEGNPKKINGRFTEYTVSNGYTVRNYTGMQKVKGSSRPRFLDLWNVYDQEGNQIYSYKDKELEFFERQFEDMGYKMTYKKPDSLFSNTWNVDNYPYSEPPCKI